METRVHFRFPSLSAGGKTISASSNQLPVTFTWIRTGLLNAALCGGVGLYRRPRPAWLGRRSGLPDLSALRRQRRPLLPHHSRLPRKAELSAEGRSLRTSASSGLNISAPCGKRRWTWPPKPVSHYSLGIQSGRRPVWARTTTMAAMTTFIPTTMAAVFQVHLDLVDFSEITSQPS